MVLKTMKCENIVVTGGVKEQTQLLARVWALHLCPCMGSTCDDTCLGSVPAL